MRRVLQPKWKLLIIVQLKYQAQIMFKTCYGSVCSFHWHLRRNVKRLLILTLNFPVVIPGPSCTSRASAIIRSEDRVRFLGIIQKLKYLCLKQCRLNSWRVSKCLPFLSQVNTSPYHVKMRYTQRKRLRTRKWRRQVRSPHLLVFKH